MIKTSHSSIQFTQSTVIKSSSPKLMSIEVQKTHNAYCLARDSKLFRVPRIIEYDQDSGICIQERIPGLLPISSMIYQRPDLLAKIGHVLAVIHQSLKLSESMTIPLPHALDSDGSKVYIHGDFNGQNVCYAPQSNDIVVLDWQMTSRHGGLSTFGTRYFDLIWFINYFIWTPSFRHLFHDPITLLSKSFLSAYYRESGTTCDPMSLARYATKFFELKRPHRRAQMNRKLFWLIPRCQHITQSFVNSIYQQ